MTTTVTIEIRTQPDGTATITVTTVSDAAPEQARTLNLTAGSPEPK